MIDAHELGDTRSFVYHYTRAETALDKILGSMTIRLGPIADANDPWEGRRQRVGFSTPRHPDTYTPAEASASIAAFDEVDRAVGQARVACFCRDDDAASQEPRRAQFLARSSCGWARDRMWAQYADGHRGVCLCFDRDELLASFRSALSGQGECLDGDVTYGDEQYERGSLLVDMDAARALGAAQNALRHREQHARVRYFTKRQDWSGEREWRTVLLDDRPAGDCAFLPIAGTLRAIIVGHRFDDTQHPNVQEICKREGIRAFKLIYSGIACLSRYDLEPVRAS